MTGQLHPQAEIITAPIQEAVRTLGHVGLSEAVQVEIPAPQGVEAAISIAEAANYQGSWMLAQQERMADPSFKAKYDKMVEDSLPTLKAGEPAGKLEKPSSFQAYHQELADTINDRSEHVYAAVGNVPAKEHSKGAHQLGAGHIGEQGTVYSDATNTAGGPPLTDRQKDIVAAHEAYHGMVTAPGAVSVELAGAFDSEAYNEIVEAEGIKQPTYLQNPDEKMARMAQLKNYFGMKGGEAFTQDHLDYARAHYVEDTGLDNAMSLLLRTVTQKTGAGFLRAMNTLPI